MTNHRFILGDSNNLSAVLDNSINLIVTSPPYPMIAMWDDMFCQQDMSIKTDLDNNDGKSAFEKMHLILDKVWEECDRVLCDNGFICINVGDATRTLLDKFELYSNHTRIINFFQSKGYSVLPDILWRKQSNSPNKFMGSGMYPAGAYVTYEHEYILVFRKGGKRMFSGAEKLLRQESAYFWEERNVWFSDLWDIKGISQAISTKNGGRDRNASYPFEIPYRLINMYSVKGDTVLDPFAGMCTTAIASACLGRNSVSVEIEPEILEIAMDSFPKDISFYNEIIDNRIKNHNTFVDSLSAEKLEKCYQNENHDFKVKTKQEMKIKLDKISEIEIKEDNIVIK